MSNFENKQKKAIEKKERNRIIKDKIGDLFFSMSNTVFGALVIGAALLWFQDDVVNLDLIPLVLVIGVIAIIFFVLIGLRFLK